jgi:hypothetical protein
MHDETERSSMNYNQMMKQKADPLRVSQARFLFKEAVKKLEEQNLTTEPPMTRHYMVKKAFETLHVNGYTMKEAMTMLAEDLVAKHADAHTLVTAGAARE